MQSKNGSDDFLMAADDSPVDLFRLFEDAVEVALARQERAHFLTWLRDSLPDYVNDPQLAVSPEACNALTLALGRPLWNAIPLPRLGFRPDTMPEPGRNDECPCGSGRKYKHCCRKAPQLPPIDTATLWPQILQKLSPEERARAFATHRVPMPAVAHFTAEQVEEGRADEAAELLEMCVEPALSAADENAAMLVDALCNAYDAIDSDEDKEEFLQRVTELPRPSPLRAEGLARLAMVRMDQGEEDAAWAAFKQAQRDWPKMESLPYIEIMLLLASERFDEARSRARTALQRATRMGAEPGEPIVEFLQKVIDDPESVVDAIPDDVLPDDDDELLEFAGSASPLRDWLEAVSHRTVPRYTLARDAAAGSRWVVPPSLRPTESAWRKAFPLARPIGTLEEPMDEAAAWPPQVYERWRRVLDEHPEAYDSLDILDDLSTALLAHPDAGDLEFEADLRTVLERSLSIVLTSLVDAGNVETPWVVSDNRPALRSLNRLLDLERDDDEVRAREIAELMLALNPNDNHGVRGWLVNECLLSGTNEDALALCERYTNDFLPETRFGRALALKRLGREAEATEALASAHSRFPHVARYLLDEDAEAPELDAIGVRVGGEDQAWLYSEDIRDAWTSTPGAMAMLRAVAPSNSP